MSWKATLIEWIEVGNSMPVKELVEYIVFRLRGASLS